MKKIFIFERINKNKYIKIKKNFLTLNIEQTNLIKKFWILKLNSRFASTNWKITITKSWLVKLYLI